MLAHVCGCAVDMMPIHGQQSRNLTEVIASVASIVAISLAIGQARLLTAEQECKARIDFPVTPIY